MTLLVSKNNSLLFIASILVCVLLLVSPSNTIAQTGTKTQNKKDLENKKKKLNEEITQINSILKETKANKKQSLTQLATISKKINVREELISTINTEISQLNSEINVHQSEITGLKKNVEKLKLEYARMIYFAQRNQSTYNKLMFIFASENFAQAQLRLKYFQQYSQFRKKQADEIIATQQKLKTKVTELETTRHDKNKLLGKEEEEKHTLSKEKEEQVFVLTSLQQKEKELKTKLEKKKKDAENLQLTIKKLIEAEIKRKVEEAAKAAALAAEKNTKTTTTTKETKNNTTKTNTNTTAIPTKTTTTKETKLIIPELSVEAEALGVDFASSRGKLPWPVAKGIICEGYGEHEHPAIKGFMIYNNGVEICANNGAVARAVFDGEVTGISNSPAGGKLVIVRHGEYLSVYSNLADVSVKTGDKINVKQTIGTIMYDEDEGKTSMNLQIWKGQKTMDPSGWLNGAR